MKKTPSSASATASTGEDQTAADAVMPVTAPIADETLPAAADEPAIPNPHEGGCYIRQPDGTLSREED